MGGGLIQNQPATLVVNLGPFARKRGRLTKDPGTYHEELQRKDVWTKKSGCVGSISSEEALYACHVSQAFSGINQFATQIEPAAVTQKAVL